MRRNKQWQGRLREKTSKIEYRKEREMINRKRGRERERRERDNDREGEIKI